MAEKKTTEEVQPDPVPAPAPEHSELKTGTPTPEAIRAERERVDNEHHPQLPEALNSEGEVITQNDEPVTDVDVEDMRAMIPPPATSSYVTFPDHLRDETENDSADLHREDVFDEAGNKIGVKGHWVQVVQIRTFDDGRVPQVSLRCECNREYTIDWTGDVAEKVVRASRA